MAEFANGAFCASLPFVTGAAHGRCQPEAVIGPKVSALDAAGAKKFVHHAESGHLTALGRFP